MKTLFLFIVLVFSGTAFAGGTNKFEVPGYSIGTPSPARGDEWWMPATNPLEKSRYALTDKTLDHPLTVTILRYASAEDAKKAFELSWGSRPQAPNDLKIERWDAAHRWPTDIFLLKRDYVVGLYDMPLDFSTTRMNQVLEALADYVAKAEAAASHHGDATKYFQGYLSACGTNEIRCVWFLDDQPNVGMVMTLNLRNSSVFTVRDVYNWAMQNSETRTLTDSQVLSLRNIIAQMPASDEQVEFNRSVSVSLRRSDEVEIFHYDRRHAPDVIQRLYDIGGGYFYDRSKN